MRCPGCNSVRSRVTTTRPPDEFGKLPRYRQCLSCGHRWKTTEGADRPAIRRIMRLLEALPEPELEMLAERYEATVVRRK